ncbi:hypothetical protein BDR07DRAFT_1580225 [Suillus spraguei]|nr:hypothetical protein BDR07DRAFT_1580225 [Suillus spraguei]
MKIENGKNIIALTMDDPMVMQSFHHKFKSEYHRVITLACFLHGLNTIIGKIALYPTMKKWQQTQSLNINCSMKTNTESCWYALILQAMSIEAYRGALGRILIKTVLYDPLYWPHLGQFIKTCKPIIDAIRNLESQDATLADCMLELIWCARQMMCLQLEDGKDINFWMHAKAVFNREFHAINTDIHALAFFLHPMCWKLAVSQAAKSQTFEQMSVKLVENLKQYYQCKGPFAGENLPISAKSYPLKTLAITLFSIVPHVADVERLFSDLGRIQVRTFETLRKLCNNYSYHVHQRALAAGQPVHLAMDPDTNFTWTPPLLEGPESLTEDEIEQCIAELPLVIDPQLEGYEILAGKVYDLAELEQVDKGIMPGAFKDNVHQVESDLEDDISWDVQSLLTMKGVSSM